MGEKSVPLSVRLSREDAAYIAALEAPDAVTMSEKVRHLVSSSRIAAARGQTFAGVVEQTEDALAPLTEALDDLEQAGGSHSALLRTLIRTLPRMLADLEAAQVDDAPAALERLTALEASSARRMRDLLDQLARLAVTREAPCLDPRILQRELAAPLIELVNLIQTHSNTDANAQESIR
jgi:hypothetical protein